MAKITVDLEAFYGYSCGCHGHGSNGTVEVEVSDKELDALKDFGNEEITADDIVAAIESGDSTLQSLHDQLSEKFYYMVEEYWLYEAYNEFLYERLERFIEQDISDGLYTPVMNEEDNEYMICGYEDLEEEVADNNYDLTAYYNWIKEHDHAFAADRLGLNIDLCREEEVDYTIRLNELG